jgi:RNase P protein component
MIKSGSYIFVARQNIIDAKYEDLKKGLIKSLKKVNALKEDIR